MASNIFTIFFTLGSVCSVGVGAEKYEGSSVRMCVCVWLCVCICQSWSGPPCVTMSSQNFSTVNNADGSEKQADGDPPSNTLMHKSVPNLCMIGSSRG